MFLFSNLVRVCSYVASVICYSFVVFNSYNKYQCFCFVHFSCSIYKLFYAIFFSN